MRFASALCVEYSGPEIYFTRVYLNFLDTLLDTDNLGFFMLPSDVALKLDPVLNVHVKNYAANETLFFQDFVTSYVRVLEQGCVNLRDTV